jgi:hypothetical protein
MRQSIALVFLFTVGCGAAPNPVSTSKADTDAARAFVVKLYPTADEFVVEEPEYAAIAVIPKIGPGDKSPDRSAACGIRVRFRYREENRTSHYDSLVWVTSEHKAINWTSDTHGDKWREYVRSLGKK